MYYLNNLTSAFQEWVCGSQKFSLTFEKEIVPEVNLQRDSSKCKSAIKALYSFPVFFVVWAQFLGYQEVERKPKSNDFHVIYLMM
jgi:hypothetical protein